MVLLRLSSSYGEGGAPLTEYERARLRVTVNVDALEEYLRATAGRDRRMLIAHFATKFLLEDAQAIDPEMADDCAEWVGPDGSEFLEPLSVEIGFRITDPDLRKLWYRIEPNGTGRISSGTT